MIVTGAHGFIGSAFCKVAGHTFDILPILRNTKPPWPNADIVVHLAARTAKVKNDPTGLATYRHDNVLRTKQLFKNLSTKPLYFLYISTMDVTKTPLTPYAQSKLEAENVVTEYCNKKHIPFGIARLGSVYGPGEGEYGKVIPTFIRAALAGEPLTVTNPRETRRFIYVCDVAGELVRMIKNKTTGIVQVIGTKEISIGQLAKYINALIQKGYKPRDSFEKNLQSEIEWFQKHRTIFFDVDGTILDHWKRMYAVYKICCQHYGYTPLPFARYKQNKKNGLSDATTKYRQWKRQRIEAPLLLATDTLIPGMKNVLARLHSIHKLVIVSARQSKSKLEKQLVNFGIRNYFDTVIADPAKVMQGGTAVGDTEVEIEAAARAGIDCISVSWGTRSEEFLRKHGATKIVHTPRAILRLLLV